MDTTQTTLGRIQRSVWDGRLPLEITLAPSESRIFDQTETYLVRNSGPGSNWTIPDIATNPTQISYPRISYLPSLLTRLKTFFSPSLIDPSSAAHHGWFSFEGVPLKWHYPVGLLFDLYAGADPASSKGSSGDGSDKEEALPWRVMVHFSDWPDEELVRLDPDGLVMNDAFINSVKEADFLRNGTAKGIMSLSKEDSFGLWNAVEEVDLPSFQRISNILLPPPSQPFRNIPIRIFLPLPPDQDSPSLKVVQSPLPPSIQAQTPNPSNAGQAQTQAARGSGAPGTQPQTVGTALHTLLPNLFPSRRTPVLAKPVLHGAVVPMSAPVEEVVRCSAYGDGWVYVVVRMMG